MSQVTTVGRLLAAIHQASPALRDAVAAAAGLTVERVDGAMLERLRLTLSEQLRLSEATAIVAPKFSRLALRLRAQALAARSFEGGGLVDRHLESPVERWERSPQMRR
jgi:hypothetical protein